MVDQEEETKILSQLETKEDNAQVLDLIDGGISLGYVAVDIEGVTLRMLKFYLYDDKVKGEMERSFFLDTLMRSAASYGESKGANKLICLDKNQLDFLSKKGFDIEEDIATADMSLIVHYS